MKIIRFLGGLGNQMFQYACYEALKHKFPDVKADLRSFTHERHHNGYELGRIFNIDVDEASPLLCGIYNIENKHWMSRFVRKVLNLKDFYQEERIHFRFDSTIFSESRFIYYYGFWQNEQYFAPIACQIKNRFKFKIPLDERNDNLLNRIKQVNSVSVHVRRGDYVNHPAFGGICELDYYRRAIQQINQRTSSVQFFIFSDDIQWCKTHLDIPDGEFVSWNIGSDNYIDMQLMSNCKHNIIANSSFSWWAAWLNGNSDKIVIGPKKWLNDSRYDTSTLLPAGWTRL